MAVCFTVTGVLLTNNFFMLPVAALEKEGISTECGYTNVHIHDASCYDAEGVLWCELVENKESEETTTETEEETESEEDTAESEEETESEENTAESEEKTESEESTAESEEETESEEYVAAVQQLEENKVRVSAAEKADKKNLINMIPMTSTNAFIEVDLYDYSININDKYYSDATWPGFQQDYGQNGSNTIYGTHSSNFGNNITSDLKAGVSDITVKNGTTINAVTDNEAGIANSPLSGVLQHTLSSDGYPILRATSGSEIEYKLDYLWKDNMYATQVNKEKGSIDGLFQKDEVTGAYYFNSRKNHAQYDADKNQFVLYDALITSNVIWYPFGNFLPFNDITTQCVAAIDVNRAYLSAISASALAKYDQNNEIEYKTLSEALEKWILKMDAAFEGESWTIFDAMQAYFNGPNGPGSAAGISFDFTNEHIQDIYAIDFDEKTDFFFGMEINMEFVQAKGGLAGNDTNQDGIADYPMVFEFIGDDDVWVYIDDKLVLDLSGIHRHVGGTIDFQKGIISYYSLNAATGEADIPYKIVKFEEVGLVSSGETTLKDYSEHTFKMYYMERGAGSSVCSMNFNMPLVQKNTIALTKHLTVSDESVSYFGDTNFKFQILDADMDGNKTNHPIMQEGTPFQVWDKNGNYLRTDTVGKNGIFILGASETAVFPEVSETYGKYYIRELFVPGTEEQYQSGFTDGQHNTMYADVVNVEIDGVGYVGKDSLVHDIKDGTTLFTMENQIQIDKLGKVSIQKEVITLNVDHDETFVFEVMLDGKALPKDMTYQVGTENRTVTEEGKIYLKAGETATFSDILSGTVFTVKETEVSANGYAVEYELDGESKGSDGVSGVVQTESCMKVLIRNHEDSASVSIPVVKKLEKPNGKEHIYKMYLQQVTDATGNTAAESTYNKVLTLPAIKTEPVNGAFEIGYSEKNLGTLPKTFYYKITELDSDDQETAYDTSSYVVEVTVTRDADQKLQAAVTRTWKDGVEYSEEMISFTNLIISYILPETGGNGTMLYTACGIVFIVCAVLWLIYIKKKEVRRGMKQ